MNAAKVRAPTGAPNIASHVAAVGAMRGRLFDEINPEKRMYRKVADYRDVRLRLSIKARSTSLIRF
jgi:hypothetical protein